MYIKGIYKKNIYNNDNFYTVGLIKIKENDISEEFNNKTITFTGYFPNINIEDNLKLTGELIIHNKYGEQFNAKNYEVLMPENESGIITFLSSEIFKGIGENKAQKIYDKFGDDTISTIINNPEKLKDIGGLTNKNIEMLHEKLLEYNENIDIIVKLNEYGFSNKESSFLYHKYKDKILSIISNDIYELFYDNDIFTYKKIDLIALRNNISYDDKGRIKAGIIFVIREVMNSFGNTYLIKDEIYNYLFSALKMDISAENIDLLLEELIKDNKIILDNDKYYLKRMYDSENNIANRLSYLNNKAEKKFKNIDNILEEIQNINQITYNNEQLLAIKSSFIKDFLIITGGPGTGKTTIIKSIVLLYKELFKKDNFDEIALLAPTGRASKRLMETTNVPSSTIHRFLKWNKDSNKFAINEYNKACEKIIIIDEASMIDTYLFDSLLKGIKYDTKIILVGDYNQLPSVGPGNVLKDLILSDKFMVIKLKDLYRQKENSNIISLAYDINKGELNFDIFNQDPDLTFIEANSDNVIEKFREICLSYQNYFCGDIQILCPMYKTINGIDKLNVISQEIFNKKTNKNNEIIINDIKYMVFDKVIELVNMPESNVYNGDVGFITRIDNINKEVYVDYDGNIVKYTKKCFNNFRLGYVTSIHKSQGNEFNVVIILLLNEYQRMLYRKLIYTGVTRAKTNLYIIGELSALIKSISNNETEIRKTTLIDMIKRRYLESNE